MDNILSRKMQNNRNQNNCGTRKCRWCRPPYQNRADSVENQSNSLKAQNLDAQAIFHKLKVSVVSLFVNQCYMYVFMNCRPNLSPTREENS